MNGRRPPRLLRSAISLATTLAVIVGVPLLLAAWVGWPLPTAIPSLDSLEQGIRSGISDQVIINTLAVLAWIVWAQLTLALLAETAAVARGRQVIHLPVLPGFQVTAARLVAGILVFGSAMAPTRALAAEPLLPVIAESTAETPSTLAGSATSSNSDGPQLDVGQAPAPAAAPTQHPTVTVERHDSYWAIAERTLGDGLRWQEILDLNAERTLPDGTVIRAGDDTLHAGWVLLLPADATSVSAPPTESPAVLVTEVTSTTPTTTTATTVVEQGDNLWSISEEQLEADLQREPADPEVAPYWRGVVYANRERYVRPGDPDLIHPGQVLVLPSTGHEQPALRPTGDGEPVPPSDDPAEPTEPTPTPADSEPEVSTVEEAPATATTLTPDVPESAPEPVDEPSSDETTDDNDAIDTALPVAVVLGALSSIALAVGLKRLLDRRRRRFANEHPGQVPGRTPPDQRDFHHAVIAQADDERIDDLRGALGRLSVALAEIGSERRPRIIRHSDDGLEVLLDQPDTNPPQGWDSTDDGTVWTLAEQPDACTPYDGPPSPAPLMVTIGQPEDDAQLYLDLEADGLLALSGESDVAANLARSIATELTLSPLAESIRVIAVGELLDVEDDVLDHLRVVGEWHEVADDLIAWATESHEALIENDWANAFVGRGDDPDHDALVPLAVVADRPPPDELVTALRAAQPSAVAITVVGDFDGALARVRCEEDALNFDTIDLACSPQGLDTDELGDISRVLIAADSPEEVELFDQLRMHYQPANSSDGRGLDAERGDRAAVDEAELVIDADGPPGYDVLVRLLGDITVEGSKRLKPKPTAVVAYLAINRSVSTERLEEACWFGSDGTSHRKRLRDTMTEARQAFGSQHFPANRGDGYAVGPRVRTDLDLFDWHVQRAADLPPDEAVEHYRTALDLVTGKPFSYPNAARSSYGWVDFGHLASTWEHRVAGVAQACAAMYLDFGAVDEAITMLRRLAPALSLNSAVVEMLMRAHIASDDRTGAESVYQEHADALEQAKLGDPAETIEQLRAELLDK